MKKYSKKLEKYRIENCNTCKFELKARKSIPCFLCTLGDEWEPKKIGGNF